MADKPKSSRYSGLWLALLAGASLRLIILAADAVPFNADEAVVALMARHSLQGKWPAFFYGQSYMGSLDATLIAGFYALVGESVWAVRLVQSLLFHGLIATTYLLGWRVYSDRWTAGTAALLLALPTVLVSTYTTATLGGYGEILLLGNVVLLLTLATGATAGNRAQHWLTWIGLGAAAGLGFWTSALIVVYLLPAGLLIALRLVRRELRPTYVLAAAVAFIVFSSPWWWHNLDHEWSALRFVLTGTEESGVGIGSVSLGTRLAGMALFGLPALFGLRFPWSADYLLLPISAFVLAFYLLTMAHAVDRWRRPPRNSGLTLLLGMGMCFLFLFVPSRFGTDATGRYFLPLIVPLALWTADLLTRIRSSYPAVAWLALVCLLGFNLFGNALAIRRNPPGLTTQFDPSNRFDNAHDEELIAFLQQTGVTRGYSNYFVAFRIAFLSHESIILASQLPYKPDLSYNPADDRYQPYTSAVAMADRVVYVTSIHPALDAILAERLTAAGVGFAEKQIGPYHLFYDLTHKVTPQELGFGRP